MPNASVSSKRSLIVAFITIFLDLVGFGIIIPIQPFFAENIFQATPTQITLISASYSFMQFLFSPFWGALSDRVGRRPIILFSVFISAIGHFIFALSTSLLWLFIARGIAGFGNANIGTAQAIIADSTTPENRTKGMALIGIAFGLGFVLGPAIGALLGQHHPTTPLFAAGFLALINLALAYFFLPETLHEKSTKSTRRLLPLEQFKIAGAYHNIKPILFISLLYTFSFGLFEQCISLYIEDIWVSQDLSSEVRVKNASQLTGIFLVVVGFTALIVQGGLVGRLNKMLGEVNLIKTGLTFLFVSIVSLPFLGQLGNFTIFLIAAPIIAAGTGLLNPAKSSLISRSIPDNIQGSMLGLNNSFSALGRVIGPSLAGLIFESQRDFPFYTSAIFLLFCLVIARSLQPANQKSTS